MTLTNRCSGVSLLVTIKGINDSEFSQAIQQKGLSRGGSYLGELYSVVVGLLERFCLMR